MGAAQGLLLSRDNTPLQHTSQKRPNLLIEGGGNGPITLAAWGCIASGDLVLYRICAPVVLIMGGEHMLPSDEKLSGLLLLVPFQVITL